MESRQGQWTIDKDSDVVCSDGSKVGSVVAVHPRYIVVEKGFFFPTDYYIPTSAIDEVEDGRVHLNVTKDQALDQSWEAPPTEETGYRVRDRPVRDAIGTDTMAAAIGLEHHTVAGDVTHVVEGDVLQVPVHEEELSAVTRQREVGEVQVSKNVVSEERMLEVPVTEERVRVQRVAVNREAGADETAFQEGIIEVPIRGEEVELQKRTRVAEEVEIAKEAVQRTEQVGGTVRREEVVVDETSVDTTG